MAGSLTATIDDFAALKKRVAEASDVVASNGLKKQLAEVRTELKREKAERASAKSEAEKANAEVQLVSAQRDQSDEKVVHLKNEIRRLKERLETKMPSKA